MSFWEKENDEENEENDDEEDEEFKSSKDRIIFLIDARSSMKEVNSRGESHIKNCLHVALEVMKTKIVAQDAAAVGVMFFGSREKDSSESMDGVYTLCPLAPPSAEMIRKVKTILNNDISIFDGMIGSQSVEKRSCPLKQALWACSQMFSTKDLKKTDFKRIWIFTNDDNPNSTFPVEQKAIITVAKDCAEAGIEISLWHLNSSHHVFDPKIFYEKLLLAATAASASSEEAGEGSSGRRDDEDGAGALEQRMLGAGFDGFDALLSSVKRKEYRKRRLCRFLFSFGFPAGSLQSLDAMNASLVASASQPVIAQSQMQTMLSQTQVSSTATAAPPVHPPQVMGIQLYKLLSITKRPYHTWLYARTNEPLKTKTTYFIERTGERLDNQNIQTYLEVAGTRVSMDSEDMKSLKRSGNVGNIGMRFIGCLRRQDVPVDLNVESPYFIYPDETMMKGSNVMFESFLRESANKDLIPVVRFNRLGTTAPRIAILLPQLEQIDTENDCMQLVPPGFHVIQLPFADEIRYNPYQGSSHYETLFTTTSTNAATTNKEQTAIASTIHDLVEAMSFPSDFQVQQTVENPSLQQFYAVIQTIALNDEDLEWQADRDDNMKPSSEIISRLEHTLIPRLKEKVQWVDGDDEPVKKPVSDFVLCVLEGV